MSDCNESLRVSRRGLLGGAASLSLWGFLPRTVRALMSMLGATEQRGLGLMSYLLFQSSYTRELIALGRKDTLAQRERVIEFFGAPSI